MKVKRFAAVALAGVMGMSMLAGCGDSGKDESTTAAKSDATEATDATEAASEEEAIKTTLTVWGPAEDQSPDYGEWLQTTCEAFKKEHPNWDLGYGTDFFHANLQHNFYCMTLCHSFLPVLF